MKYVLFVFSFLCFSIDASFNHFSQSLQYDCGPKHQTMASYNNNYKNKNGEASFFSVEPHLYLFLPTGEKAKKTFGKHWLRYQVLFYVLTKEFCENKKLYVFCGYNLLKKSGKPITQLALQSGIKINSLKTEMTIVPLLAGVRFVVACNDWLKLHTDVGIYYPFVSIRNTGDSVIECLTRSVGGLIVQGGISLYPSSCFSIDFGINYTSARLPRKTPKYCVEASNRPFKLSGISVGGGFGFHF